MHHIVYMSRATDEMQHDDLVALLRQCWQANAQLGVTGALVYGDQQFIQVIEGEEPVVSALFARIARDPRHYNVFKMVDEPIEERLFLEWSMAFHVVATDQFEELAGYVSPDWLEELLFATNTADAMLLERMRELVTSTHEGH